MDALVALATAAGVDGSDTRELALEMTAGASSSSRSPSGTASAGVARALRITVEALAAVETDDAADAAPAAAAVPGFDAGDDVDTGEASACNGAGDAGDAADSGTGGCEERNRCIPAPWPSLVPVLPSPCAIPAALATLKVCRLGAHRACSAVLRAEQM